MLWEIKHILDDYGISSATGDQFCADVISQHLLKLGIFYKISVAGAHTRAKIFGNLKHLLVQGKIELLDEPESLQQFRSLREEKTDRGHIDVRPGGGVNDDLAYAVALAANELTNRPSRPDPFLMPTGERDLHFVPNPTSCQVQEICRNFPRCLDEGACQGFVDNRVTV